MKASQSNSRFFGSTGHSVVNGAANVTDNRRQAVQPRKTTPPQAPKRTLSNNGTHGCAGCGKH